MKLRIRDPRPARGAQKDRSVAVVLAGGTGERMGLDVPKQLIKIAGKPVLEHTLDRFQAASAIDEIIVMMAADHVPAAEKILARGGHPKVTKVIAGGASRTETTMRALDALGPDECNVLFHDGVRPFVDDRIISECVDALRDHEAVDVVIPSSDTIITVDEYSGSVIKDVPRRDLLRRGQTPQGFRLSAIRRAYELALGDPDFVNGRVPATDDCGIVLRYLPGAPVRVVAGSEQNMKITYPVDVHLADKLFQLAGGSAPRHASSLRLDGRTVVVFGGSYGIGADIVRLARELGADAFSFSRSQTGTHVENVDDMEVALEKAHQETGRIDYVVNTAGVLHRGELTAMTEAAIEESVRINYLGPVTVARAAAGYLRETEGQLLLFTSSSYTRGRAGYSLYSSTKAAVVNLTQALADEWSPAGVRVNCINPERTATPMRTRAFGAEPPESLLSSATVARTAIDVLASDLTGHVIDVRRDDPLEPAVTKGPNRPDQRP